VGGLMLGAIQDTEYESNIIALKPNDLIFFYTDGVTEAFDESENQFGEDNLCSIFHNKNLSVKNVVYNVLEKVQLFSNGIEQSDDITCVALQYLNK
jgi:sigma-B regulation protein RsbU (phosphoserine phosphatase)